jgi:fatty-acyl-CoA synthase
METVADVLADWPAIVHRGRVRTWADLDERACRLASYLAANGIGHGSRVAIAQYNGIEYVECILAALKLRAVPVNVNYRYRESELRYLLNDAEAEALLFDAALTDRVAAVRADLPRLRTLVRVGGPAGSDPWVAFDAAVAESPPLPRMQRGDDHWLMYTGGTTGYPKGVLSRHSWLFNTCVVHGIALLGERTPTSVAELAALARRRRDSSERLVWLPAAPLMHGTGVYTTLGSLLAGGTVVFLSARSYDPAELARLIGDYRVTDVSLVGDVFARPLADVLEQAEAGGRPFDLSSLRRILSVGVTWTAEAKERLLRHGDFACRDVVAASEGGPFAISITASGEAAVTSRFVLIPGARVITGDGADVKPGSGEVGYLAAPADDEICYLGDAAKTTETFRFIDGRRYVVPGDMATLTEDGEVVFKGRGSRVINTGGEKVFAEEVEEVVLANPAVQDVNVVGVPDERWGQRVVAVVAPAPGASVTEEDVRASVGERLADYKRPRQVVVVPEIQRTPAGKANLAWAMRMATGIPDGKSADADVR